MSIDEYVINLRRELHMHPEQSMHEEWTSRRIMGELDALGVPYERVGDKNVVAKLCFGEGKRVAVRADFDALPIEEAVDVPWRSRNPGYMHACGHDGHTAALMGLARVLAKPAMALKGTVYLCFQQGEETGGGAAECIDYLKREGGVDLVFGTHLLPFRENGVMDVTSGVRACGCVVFRIKLSGKGGHGSRPDVTSNLVAMACDLYGRLVSIPVNRFEAWRNCVVSPCVVQAGVTPNVLPEIARVEGTIRFSDEADAQPLMRLVEQAANCSAEYYGGSAETSFTMAADHPVRNDPAASELAAKAALACGFELPKLTAMPASDNFADYLHEFAGFYALVGCKSARAGVSGIPHRPDFDFDEAVLPRLVRFYSECLRLAMGD